ncbi:ABC-F family ATP-binding cassette domain-containing protein [Bacillus thuringiensis]|nr:MULTISPECIES: ABC-F family ATP-binding cassette domain-containing protein [Bacillus cereus group]MCC6082068.1 ATP-binding cassette domain-containing protein [Bacillus thuringiensis]MED3446806.1 ABC-F family ATP-binding cassette domain-containing protein [Bacillus thuringiensis]PEB54492.1 ABC transporter ATP-binding protein [Bacillus cereus]PEB85641.1 ABC transporter ATP-binding protein [Bacillus thuringiensis]PGK93096.1 ABC transporter ATP-binding protein [Bacillus thuringiensis]
MLLCSGKEINKAYAGSVVLRNLSFDVYEADCIGVVGRNGSGKTTFLKLLAGIEKPDSGSLHWRKDRKIGYLAQIPMYSNTVTGLDVLKMAFKELLDMEQEMRNIENQMGNEGNEANLAKLMERYGSLQDQFVLNNGYEMDSNIESVATGLQIMDLLPKPFNFLSGGEKTKICLGLLLLEKPDILLLDEPTNHLDLEAVDWLTAYIKNYPGAAIVISHDRYFLDEISTKIFDIEDGELIIYHTNFSKYVLEKEENLLREFENYKIQQQKIKKMKQTIKTLKEWANRANPPNANMHRRARSMERALEKIEKVERPVLNRKKMKLQLESSERSGNDIVIVEDVDKWIMENQLFEKVNMHIRYQDRTVLLGRNGTGKSTLLKMIMNKIEIDKGNISVGGSVKIGYISQDIFTSVEKNETVIGTFREEVSMTEGDARKVLASFLFYGDSVYKPISKLSGGELMRLRIAQLMHQDTNFLVLDEPTNHLDIESRELLEEALEKFDGTILAVSHDRYFINKLFNKIYWIEDRKLAFFYGNYELARNKMQNSKTTNKVKNHKKVKRNLPERREIEKDDLYILECELKEIEKGISGITDEMVKCNNHELLEKLYYEKLILDQKREEIFNKLEVILNI